LGISRGLTASPESSVFRIQNPHQHSSKAMPYSKTYRSVAILAQLFRLTQQDVVLMYFEFKIQQQGDTHAEA
jgi:hypothetical protein